MRPATVHLLAQVIRHGRGICTAIEKWARAVPDDARGTDAIGIVAVGRVALAAVEDALITPRPETAAQCEAPIGLTAGSRHAVPASRTTGASVRL